MRRGGVGAILLGFLSSKMRGGGGIFFDIVFTAKKRVPSRSVSFSNKPLYAGCGAWKKSRK
jgi:hypothetical protein